MYMYLCNRYIFAICIQLAAVGFSVQHLEYIIVPQSYFYCMVGVWSRRIWTPSSRWRL